VAADRGALSGAAMIEPNSVQTSVDFFRQVLEPDYRECIAAPADLRKAFHAAASLFHLRDWIAATESPNPTKEELKKLQSDLQAKLVARCEFFAIIRDVANASKHLKLIMKPSTSVTGAADIRSQEIATAAYNVAGGYNVAGAYGPVLAVVIIPEGVVFAEAAAKVYEMWKEVFREKGWNY
jgi:hypothetical protein